MQLDRNAEPLRGLEHLLGLRQRERDAFAEHVHGVHQPLGRERGQHLVADQVDVVLVAPGVFGRQRVCAEEGGAHRHAQRLAQAPRHAQLLALVLQRQAVAGLDLDGAYALVQEGLQARHGQGEELILAGRARGPHRGDDAAARARHLLVAGAGQAQRELVRALATVDQVRVAVHQPRRGELATALPARQRGKGGGQCRIGPDPAHLALLHHDRSQGACGQRHVRHGQAVGQAQALPDAVGAGGRGCLRLLHGFNS